MIEHTPLSGYCLCKAVRVFIPPAAHHVSACHCDMCRRWGGGPLLSIESGRGVVIEGEENVTVYRSSDWAERGFCKHCGSHLFYRTHDQGFYALPAGLFDKADHLNFALQVFIDQKPPYYSFADETKTMTRAEVIALFKQ